MVRCSKCGAENPDNGKYCKECGLSLNDSKNDEKDSNWKAWEIMLLLIAFGFIGYMMLGIFGMIIGVIVVVGYLIYEKLTLNNE